LIQAAIVVMEEAKLVKRRNCKCLKIQAVGSCTIQILQSSPTHRLHRKMADKHLTQEDLRHLRMQWLGDHKILMEAGVVALAFPIK
jgi:hypothetical protein